MRGSVTDPPSIMPILDSQASPPGTTARQLPELPDGWHYTDDLVWDDSQDSRGRRRLWLLVGIAVAVAACVVGLVVFNAAGHYSRGVAALEDRSYGQAAAEFSAARLLVFPYRDAQLREEQAQRALTLQTADVAQAQARVERVSGALDEAAAALGARDAGAVLAALQAVSAKDLSAVVEDDADVRRAAAALGEDLTAAARLALRNQKWGRAGKYAAALLVLDPSAPEGAALADKATTGQKLSARLAAARDAARRGHWREALRLALAVTAAQKGFPGAAALVADARRRSRRSRSPRRRPPRPRRPRWRRPPAADPRPGRRRSRHHRDGLLWVTARRRCPTRHRVG